jgi:hypothetical protein
MNSHLHTVGRRALAPLALALALSAGSLWASTAAAPQGDTAQYRRWIAEMKEQPRGPFAAVKWFCKDGRVLQPKDYACAAKGQGWQHGEWSGRTRQLRAQGYEVATLLAGLDVEQALADPAFADRYPQWLVERFLVAADDGWILRRARTYRGAIQEEDEREFARRLLAAMAGHPDWTGHRYVALRTGARLLPHGADDASAQKVRNLAAALADRDPAFQPLRVKIHGSPAAEDAAAVRDYAARTANAEAAQRARALAVEIDRVYAPRPLAERLDASARTLAGMSSLEGRLAEARQTLAGTPDAETRLAATARMLVALRDELPSARTAAQRLALLDLSLAAEAEHLRAASELRAAAAPVTRAALLARLQAGTDAAFGTGLIGVRQRTALHGALQHLSTQDSLPLARYLAELRTVGLLPGWSSQALRMHFGEAMEKFAAIEPLADQFIQDQLRGSPLLFYSQQFDRLARDANRLAGVQHKLLGQEIGSGFSALNPGLARGVLHTAPDMRKTGSFQAEGIYLLPETVSDLPPLAGILTEGAGNPLSHVQLLARNLGIPNVAVDPQLVPQLERHDGKAVVLAVSPAGIVEIAEDGPAWDATFGKVETAQANVMFEPDLAKLDLARRDFVSLRDLRAAESGRIVGPKAAKLGELMHHFPDRIAPGVGIPFGLYREAVLDRPYKGGSQTVYQWMVESFRQLESLPAGSPEAARFGEALRAEIYQVVRNTDPGPRFRERLRAAMAREFGAGFNGGVFIRSDTNVEDLPGFTGAGLNLTLFHIVGFDKIVDGISEVWASPFTARAWAWRQSHMKGPEHVYPAVLLLRTVPSDISGVMVTQDVDRGDPGTLSVAVNEGLGGAVDGQAAESVRIDRATGFTRLMAVATAPRRLVPLATGGVGKRPASGTDTLLGPAEVSQLIAFADEIPRKFPQHGEDGKPVAADVEFAFVDGKLWLLQIRPFNESRQARGSNHLASMDRALAGRLDRSVELKGLLP